MARTHGGDAVEERLQSVEDAVNNLAKVISRAELAIKDAAKARTDAAAALRKVAVTERRYRRHTRWMAVVAIVISLLGAGGAFWWSNDRFDRINHDTVAKFETINHDKAVSAYNSCQIRNAQISVGQRYNAKFQIWQAGLFQVIAGADPALATAIEKYLREQPPPQAPTPKPVTCVRP